MQLNPEDLDQGSFAQLLAGGQPGQEAPQQGGGLGEIIAGARQSLQANPAIANALMQTFATMARSPGASVWDGLGTGVAQGAQTFMMHQAQGKEDAEKAAAIERQTKKEDRSYELDKTRTAASVKASEMSTAVNAENLRQSKELFTQKKEKLTQDIALLAEKIKNEPVERKRVEMNVQLAQLRAREAKLDLQMTERFGPIMKETELATAQANRSIAEEKATQSVLTTDEMSQEASDMAGLTPEQRLTIGKRGTSTATTSNMNKELSDSQLWAKYVELYGFDLAGRPKPLAELQKGWPAFLSTARSGGATPAAAGAAPAAETALTPEQKAAWEKARNGVKVGETYLAPNGKTMRRMN